MGKVVDPLSVENGPAIDLLGDIPDMDRRRGSYAVKDRLVVRPQVVWCDVAHYQVPPLRQDVPIEDCPAHVAGAACHRLAFHPTLGDFHEVARLLQTTFGAVHFTGERRGCCD